MLLQCVERVYLIMCGVNGNKEDRLLRKKSKIDHVLYEFEMYLMTYKYLMSYKSLCVEKEKNQFLVNLLIESHQIHLRILIDFFKKCKNILEKRKSSSKRSGLEKKDMIPQDIIKDFEVPRDGQNGKLDAADGIINKSITHISNVRCNDLTEKTEECIKNAYPIITGRISKFLDELTDEIIKINLSSEYSDEEKKRIFLFFQKKRGTLKDYLSSHDKLDATDNETKANEIVTDNMPRTGSLENNVLSFLMCQPVEGGSCQAKTGIGTSGSCNIFGFLS